MNNFVGSASESDPPPRLTISWSKPPSLSNQATEDYSTSLSNNSTMGDSPAPKQILGDYSGQNERALIWAGLYFGVWIIQRLWCNLGLPDNCEVVTEPLDVLTDLAVLFTFSLAQAWWCDLLEKDRWADTLKAPWVFVVIPITAIIISALGRIRGLEPWEYKHPGEDFEFSGIRSTLYILGLIAVVFFISWHFARAYATLVGTLFISGGKGEGIKKPEVNLHAAYTGSRAVLVLWGILFTCFLIVEDDGFDYRGALLAWVLSLLAVFPVPVSLMWLGITTGIFIQGIGANRLRFLGCDP